MKREKVRPALPAEFPDTARVLAQLDRILSTPLFQHSKRYPAFLRHVVEQTLRGANDDLKERTLGIAVFGRPPDYDTSADPVVRNTASEVRKRLQEYYSELGHQAELRISLPAGGYVPEFRLPSADHLPVAAKAARPALLRASFGIGATLLAMLVVLGETQLFSQKSAIKRFWAPILQSPDPILVVTDTLVALRDKQQTESGDNSARVREIIDPKIFLAVSEQSAKLAAFLLTQGKHVDYELARNVSLSKLRERPFILNGAFNNQWTPRAVEPFRFYFRLDREHLVRRILDRQNLQQRSWASPMTSALTEDYALIVRAPEPEAGQMMLVIAGLSEKGSAAALEFVTNSKYLDRVASKAPRGWEHRNIELVIKSNLINDDWGEPQIVATHFW